MPSEIRNFIKGNRNIFIWGVFLGLVLFVLYQGLFSLVFVTFILCYVFNGTIGWLDERTKIPRKLWTLIIYLVFVAAIATLLSFVVPRLVKEATTFVGQVPTALQNIHAYLDKLAYKYEQLQATVGGVKEFLSLDTLAGMNRDDLVRMTVHSVDQLTKYVSIFFMGVMFSFLILLDIPKLRTQVKALRSTRLKEIYEEVSGSVVSLALFVGEAFRAQVLISCVNTTLTTLGLLALQIEPVVLLAAIVFLAGLVPVLGVFISSAPILLLGFNQGGFPTVFWALGMIVAVHLIETYVLNPRIFSTIFHISPVLTLIILYIAHVLFGLWGMVLGVPVSVYVFREIITGKNKTGHAEDHDSAT